MKFKLFTTLYFVAGLSFWMISCSDTDKNDPIVADMALSDFPTYDVNSFDLVRS